MLTGFRKGLWATKAALQFAIAFTSFGGGTCAHVNIHIAKSCSALLLLRSAEVQGLGSIWSVKQIAER